MEAVLRAVADESRRTLLETLARGPATAGELAALLPIALLTPPVNVSVPTDASPVAEPAPPAPIVIVTPDVVLPYWTCVAPLPVMVSLPALPWNELKPLNADAL